MGSKRSHSVRMTECLSRLLQYVNLDQSAMTGSVAIKVNLSGSAFWTNNTNEVSDIDLVVIGLEAISLRTQRGSGFPFSPEDRDL